MLLRFHLRRLELCFRLLDNWRCLVGRGQVHQAQLGQHLLSGDSPISFQGRIDLRPPHLPRLMRELVRLVLQSTLRQPLQQIF
jgi:hypothetical protein